MNSRLEDLGPSMSKLMKTLDSNLSLELTANRITEAVQQAAQKAANRAVMQSKGNVMADYLDSMEKRLNDKMDLLVGQVAESAAQFLRKGGFRQL